MAQTVEHNGMTFTKVDSLEHLKELCADGEIHEFRLLLNYGCYSRKLVKYFGDGQWWVFNYIDTSQFDLTDEQLLTNSSIMEGINKGAFYLEAA